MNAPGLARIETLTALRGWAALWVLAYHISTDPFYQPLLGITVVDWVIDKGYLGVDLFFILSGFVLSYVYQGQLKANNRTALRRFWAARVARIWPAHLVLLAGYLGIYLASRLVGLAIDQPDRFTMFTFFLSLCNLHAWGWAPQGSWNYVSWSVSAEWFAYLAFPLLNSWLRYTSAWLNVGVTALMLGALAGFAWVLESPRIDWTYDYGLVRVSTEFVVGCCLFNLRRKWPGDFLTVASALMLLGLTLARAQHDIWIVTALAFWVPSLSQVKGRSAKMFSNPVSLYLGEISYSLYLCHQFVKLIFRHLLLRVGLATANPALVLLGLLGGVLLTATALYYIVEKPGRTWLLRRLVS